MKMRYKLHIEALYENNCYWYSLINLIFVIGIPSLRDEFYNFDSGYLSVLFATISKILEMESLFDVLFIIAVPSSRKFAVKNRVHFRV